MTRRKKTDGERIADKTFWNLFGFASKRQEKERLADSIDRLLRRRMAEAWEDGWFGSTSGKKLDVNPYRGRRRK